MDTKICTMCIIIVDMTEVCNKIMLIMILCKNDVAQTQLTTLTSCEKY